MALSSLFLRNVARSTCSAGPVRQFSSSRTVLDASKVPIALVAQLRKLNPISLSKAREALSASENSVEKALEWLQKDLEVSGAKKAEKIRQRSTDQGLIGVTVMGTRAAMVELRCETDFVSRNSVFKTLVQDVTSTAAFLDVPESEALDPIPLSVQDPLLAFPIEDLQSAPLIPVDPSTSSGQDTSSSSSLPVQTVSQAIRAAITQTGENIQLSRAVSFSSPLPPMFSSSPSLSLEKKPEIFYLPGVYVHGSTGSTNEGTVAALSILSIESTDQARPILQRIGTEDSLGADLQKLARSVSRQIVGFPTKSISRPDSSASQSQSEETGTEEGEISPYLMEQPFMMFQGESRPVQEVLGSWGSERALDVRVTGMRRWTVGEATEGSA